MNFKIFCDGGARGNPGPAGIGFLIKDEEGKILHQEGRHLGRATNNVAEYQAVMVALNWLNKNLKLKTKNLKLSFFLDSKLVVNQLNGFYKIKNANLRNLIIKVRQKERILGGEIIYHYIPREENKEADALVNRALNSVLNS